MIVSCAAFAVAFVGVFFPGGLRLKGGLIAFVWIRLALEGIRALLMKDAGSNLGWQAANLGVHVLLAGFITYAFVPYFLG